MPLHKSFGKIFTSFQPGTALGGTDDGYVFCSRVAFKIVVDAFYKRNLGSYHEHIDIVTDGKVLELVELANPYGHIFAHIGCSGIAWSYVKFIYLTALRNLPGQGVFSSATS